MGKYIVGDIHGSYAKLRKVLDKVGFDSEKDILYSVGDLCDMGHENLSVLEYLYSLNDAFRPVFGDHDIWLYRYFSYKEENRRWLNYNGGDATLSEVVNLGDRTKEKYAGWFAKFPYMRRVDDKIITHNFVPFDVINRKAPYMDVFSITLGNAGSLGFLTNSDADDEIYDKTVAGFISGDKSLMTAEYKSKDAAIQFPAGKIFIMGHAADVRGVRKYGENVYMIDSGAYMNEETYRSEGFISLLNLDTLEIFTDRD